MNADQTAAELLWETFPELDPDNHIAFHDHELVMLSGIFGTVSVCKTCSTEREGWYYLGV